MGEFINGKVKEFWSGSLVGFIAGLKFLFSGPLSWGDLLIQYTLKFIAVCIFAFMSGLFTVLAKDFYEHKIKGKIFKKKKDDRVFEENNKE